MLTRGEWTKEKESNRGRKKHVVRRRYMEVSGKMIAWVTEETKEKKRGEKRVNRRIQIKQQDVRKDQKR